MKSFAQRLNQDVIPDLMQKARRKYMSRYPLAPVALSDVMTRPLATPVEDFLEQAEGLTCWHCRARQPKTPIAETANDEVWQNLTGLSIALSVCSLIEKRRRIKLWMSRKVYRKCFRPFGFYNDYLIAMWFVTREDLYANELIDQQYSTHPHAFSSAQWAIRSLCDQSAWFKDRFEDFAVIPSTWIPPTEIGETPEWS